MAKDNLLVYFFFDDDNGSVTFDYSGNITSVADLLIRLNGQQRVRVAGLCRLLMALVGLAFEKVAYMDRPDALQYPSGLKITRC